MNTTSDVRRFRTAISVGLRGYSALETLVSYALSQMTSFQAMSNPERARIRTCFELYAGNVITANQFRLICVRFSQEVNFAANRLIFYVQGGVLPANSIGCRNWSVDETIVLLACSTGDSYSSLMRRLPHKTPRQCQDRLSTVVTSMENGQVMTDKASPVLSFTSCVIVDVRPAITRDRRVSMLKVKLMRAKSTGKKEKRRLTSKMMVVKRELSRVKKRLAQVELKLDEDFSEDPYEGPQGTCVAQLQDQMLCEMMFRSHQSQRGRPYSDELLKLSQLLRLTSPKAYRLLEQMLPIPSASCLRFHYARRFENIRQQISNPNLIEDHLFALGILEPTMPTESRLFTIGIDAFSFGSFIDKSTFKDGHPRVYNNGFVFMHVPLDADAPTAVIHIKQKENGAFDRSVMDMFNIIAAKYREKSLKVLFKATDGDRYMSPEHDKFFKTYVEPRRNSYVALLGELYEMLMSSDTTMPIADPLHFSKNLRGKLIDHNVVVINSSEKDLVYVNAGILQGVLKLEAPLKDTSLIGRMRDQFVTELFTLANVVILLKEGFYHAAMLFMPYACIFGVLYATNLTIETRLFLANLAYTTFERLLSEAEVIVKRHRTVKHRFGKGLSAVTLAEPVYIKRMMNTCLALGIAMSFGPKTLRLDAIGTHLIENQIGIARSTSNNTAYDRIISAFANSEMRKAIASECGLTLYVSHRVNDGGAKISTSQTEGLSHPKKWDVRDIVSMLHEVCAGIENVEEFKQWCNQFETFVSKMQVHHLPAPSSVANALIIERNLKLQTQGTRSKQKEHDACEQTTDE